MILPANSLPRGTLPMPWLWSRAAAVIRGALRILPALRGTVTLESN